MEIYQEELKIIDLFRRNLVAEFTLKEIMKKLGKKSYNWTYGSVLKLSKGILIARKTGNSITAKLNLSSQNTISYLSFLDRQEAYGMKNNAIHILINDLIDNLSKKNPFFILLVAGSYATGRQRQESDLDVVIIVDSDLEKKEISPYVKEATRLSEIRVEVHKFTKEEFYKMLVNDEENFGKEVFRKHLLFYGAEIYYQIMKEAIKNGLQAKT